MTEMQELFERIRNMDPQIYDVLSWIRSDYYDSEYWLEQKKQRGTPILEPRPYHFEFNDNLFNELQIMMKVIPYLYLPNNINNTKIPRITPEGKHKLEQVLTTDCFAQIRPNRWIKMPELKSRYVGRENFVVAMVLLGYEYKIVNRHYKIEFKAKINNKFWKEASRPNINDKIEMLDVHQNPTRIYTKLNSRKILSEYEYSYLKELII